MWLFFFHPPLHLSPLFEWRFLGCWSLVVTAPTNDILAPLWLSPTWHRQSYYYYNSSLPSLVMCWKCIQTIADGKEEWNLSWWLVALWKRYRAGRRDNPLARPGQKGWRKMDSPSLQLVHHGRVGFKGRHLFLIDTLRHNAMRGDGDSLYYWWSRYANWAYLIDFRLKVKTPIPPWSWHAGLGRFIPSVWRMLKKGPWRRIFELDLGRKWSHRRTKSLSIKGRQTMAIKSDDLR